MAEYDRQLAYYIDGIRCMGCVRQIETSLLKILPTHLAKIDFATKSLLLKENERRILPQIEKCISQLGFRIFPADENSLSHLNYENKKSQIKKIAIAGACAGNIMLFTIPIYAGLVGPLKLAFLWISFFLFMPVLFVSAVPFYHGAIASIKTRTLNIDLLISLALSLTSTLSIYHLFTGSDHVYFDSTASFLFLILTTRFIMDESRAKLLKPVFFDDFLKNEIYLDINDKAISLDEITVDSIIKVAPGQVIPVDGINLEQTACIDSSFLDGESAPKIYAKDARLSSGLRSYDRSIRIKATSTVKMSRLAQFIQELNQSVLSNHSSIVQADIWAQRLMGSVLGLSTLIMLSGYWLGFDKMVERGTALLVIACPCALAFAAPATVGAFIRKALKKNIFIKDTRIFDRLKNIKNVFLDKTGTLTDETLILKHISPKVMSVDYQSIILTLEQHSTHPVAFAFRKAWPNVQCELSATYVNENIGEGVSGIINGINYSVRALSELTHNEDYAVGLFRNNELISEFYFANHIKPEAFDFINALKAKNWKIFLLSGDRRSNVQSVANQLLIPPSQIYSEVYPEDKSDIVSKHPHSIMIGDGVNDALAFQKADIGISVKGHIDSQFNTAHVTITHSNLNHILQFFEITNACNKTLKRNFSLAIFYNSIGAIFAILGFVNPFVAAIAMPISSVLIIFSTWHGVK